MYRTDFWTLWEKARVGCFKRTALKHVYYLRWNRSPAQVGCMRQVLGSGALGKPRGMGWGGRWEGGSRWGTHVNPWLIHVNVWQNSLQYCKVIRLQLIKINEKKKKSREIFLHTKIHIVRAVVFKVVMYDCKSWTIKKAECQRTDAFKLWFWRRLPRVSWITRRSNQSILREIHPEYSLEWLRLKLKTPVFWSSD